jgi:PAS domain S-box-containing protein
MRQSETRMRLALEAVDLGTWQANFALDQFVWNDRTRELLAHGLGESIDYAATFLSRVHIDDRARVDDAVQSAFGAKGSGELKMDFRTIDPSDSRIRWVQVHGGPIDPLDNEAGFVGTTRDITSEKEAEAHRAILSNELEHRVGNTLAIAQVIVNQTLSGSTTLAEASKVIDARLASLGRAHKLLTQTSWKTAPIHDVIAASTAAVAVRTDRVRVNGPSINLTPRAALALAMAIHELSTNAAKYGALSNNIGSVDIDWSFAGERPEATLMLTWRERDGPLVVTPAHKGFGSKLIDTVLASDLGGECTTEYLPEGVRWTLRTTLNHVEDAL